MNLKIEQFFRLTVSILCLATGWAVAADAPARMPVAVAESDAFEVVGRLEDEGLVLYVDRADSNAPVLGATLEVELAGASAKAHFRQASGSYLIADAAWLKALRQPGKHPLAMTLVAGNEADLLAGEMDVDAAAIEAPAIFGYRPLFWGLAIAIAILGLLLWQRRAKGERA